MQNHVKTLMQHIHMATKAGYLNPQILNQPLAPTSLMLLNQLLSQIALLNKLNQHAAVQNHLKPNSMPNLQVSILITKTKSIIQNLQVSLIFKFLLL